MNAAGGWRVHVCNDYRIERCGSFMAWDRDPIRKLKGRRPEIPRDEEREYQVKIRLRIVDSRGYLHTVRGWCDKSRQKVFCDEAREEANLLKHLIADKIAKMPILPPPKQPNRKTQLDGLYACSLEAMEEAGWQRWYICGVPPLGKRGRPCWDIGSLSRVMGIQTPTSLENAA